VIRARLCVRFTTAEVARSRRFLAGLGYQVDDSHSSSRAVQLVSICDSLCQRNTANPQSRSFVASTRITDGRSGGTSCLNGYSSCFIWDLLVGHLPSLSVKPHSDPMFYSYSHRSINPPGLHVDTLPPRPRHTSLCQSTFLATLWPRTHRPPPRRAHTPRPLHSVHGGQPTVLVPILQTRPRIIPTIALEIHPRTIRHHLDSRGR
jgi:hypothetical protein